MRRRLSVHCIKKAKFINSLINNLAKFDFLQEIHAKDKTNKQTKMTFLKTKTNKQTKNLKTNPCWCVVACDGPLPATSVSRACVCVGGSGKLRRTLHLGPQGREHPYQRNDHN